MDASTSPTDRFCQRLDQHLESLTPALRKSFLRNQRIAWLERYGAFCRRVDNGKPSEFGENAADYICTIAEISKRLQAAP